MARISVPEADSLLDSEIKVLDKGFVRLVDYIGGDARVVQSARVSYGAGTKTVREDSGLINYLVKNAHTSPLEQVSLTFHIKLPLFVFAQMVRHRTAKLNSMSARYSVMPDEFYIPEPEQIRTQSNKNKQATDEPLGGAESVLMHHYFKDFCWEAYELYSELLGNPEDPDNQKVCREQARMILPQNLYTQIYWTIDLHNLFHFLRLRLDWHAQQEIRVYAEAIAQCAKAVAPICYKAFEDHILNARKFSEPEMRAIREMLAGEERPTLDSMTERARKEFDGKIWD